MWGNNNWDYLWHLDIKSLQTITAVQTSEDLNIKYKMPNNRIQHINNKKSAYLLAGG